MNLGEYLLEAARTPWQDGVHDCTAWPARWAGIEIPAYSTAAEAEAIVEAAGGLAQLWDAHIAGRLERVEAPEPGDVGVIYALTSERTITEVGAIWSGKRWTFASPVGLVSASADAIAIWRPRCPRP